MDKIIFNISSDSTIYIPLVVPESVLHLYAVGSIILAQAGHDDVVLAEDASLFCALDNLQYRLAAALCGELEVKSQDAVRGMGYSYNEYLGSMLRNKRTCGSLWGGLKHEVWSRGKGHAFTQLYTCEGKIFLEVSPYYPWHCYYKPQQGDGYIKYEEYMRTYKPIAVLELSREAAQKWLEKSKELLHIMNVNSEKIERTSDDEIDAQQMES